MSRLLLFAALVLLVGLGGTYPSFLVFLVWLVAVWVLFSVGLFAAYVAVRLICERVRR